MSSQRLSDRVALVTGAGAGIGRAIVLAFAAEGAVVACLDVDRQAAEAAAAAARAFADPAGDTFGLRCDVADPTSVHAAVDTVRERCGALHILVNAAARQDGGGRVTEIDYRDWQRTLDVNLGGAFLTCKEAIPLMADSGGGSIINVASQLARVAMPRTPAYCATKAGLVHLTRALAVDHADQGIRANSLSPGAIETQRLVAAFGDMESARSYLAPRHVLGRLGQPDEIAAAAVFLASNESSFMTGADLLVDGGYTAV